MGCARKKKFPMTLRNLFENFDGEKRVRKKNKKAKKKKANRLPTSLRVTEGTLIKTTPACNC